jgi:hypothetical protein
VGPDGHGYPRHCGEFLRGWLWVRKKADDLTYQS